MGNFTQDHRIGRLRTSLGKDVLVLLRMTAVERLSEPFTIVVDAVSERPAALHKILGGNVGVEFKSAADGVSRHFNGQLWEYVELENDEQGFHYRLTLRPMMNFMTLNRRNRIYQLKSVKDIINSVLIGEKEISTTGSYAPLEYCVQYQESDLDFVSRLMEFEGMYYFFKHSDGHHKLAIIDSRDSQVALSPGEVELLPRDERDHPYLWSMVERRGVGPAKVTVDDFDFEQPASSLRKTRPADAVLGKPSDRWKTPESGTPGDWAAAAELYHYPSKFNVK